MGITGKFGKGRRNTRARERILLLLAIPAMAVAGIGAALAQAGDGAIGNPEAGAYENCLRLADTHPRQALIEADGWIGQGGGAPARHCRALALFAQGRYEEAAQALESLAAALRRGPPGAQRLGREAGIQSGHAWLQAGQPAKAADAFSRALGEAPDDAGLLVDRAIAMMAAERPFDAIDDLNRANELAPERAGILALRASAYRRVGTLDLARDDVARALAIAPDNPEALLEQGLLARITGDEPRARQAWQTLLRLAPESAAASAARAYLADRPATNGKTD